MISPSIRFEEMSNMMLKWCIQLLINDCSGIVVLAQNTNDYHKTHCITDFEATYVGGILHHIRLSIVSG